MAQLIIVARSVEPQREGGRPHRRKLVVFLESAPSHLGAPNGKNSSSLRTERLVNLVQEFQ